MPTNSVVIVRYGPYESCGIVEHRSFRLDGLQAVLKDDGHQCVLEKTDDWNIVDLIVNGECVYTCNITDLEFGNLHQHLETSAFWMTRDVMLMKCLSNSSLLIGGDGRLDPRCQEATDACMVNSGEPIENVNLRHAAAILRGSPSAADADDRSYF